MWALHGPNDVSSLLKYLFSVANIAFFRETNKFFHEKISFSCKKSIFFPQIGYFLHFVEEFFAKNGENSAGKGWSLFRDARGSLI